MAYLVWSAGKSAPPLVGYRKYGAIEMEMTTAQERRTETMMAEYAKEPVRIEGIAGCLYVLGSELACLRIFARYQTNGAYHNPKARVGYSANLNSWYFSLETSN